MKLNLTTDYAIRAIKCIYESQEGMVTAKYISEKLHISQGVLMKVLSRLRMGNIIVSHRGRGQVTGGFSLNQSAKNVTFLEIIEIMEGPLALGVSSQSPDIAGREAQQQRGINGEYCRLNKVFREELGRYSLKEIFSQSNTL